jgi:septum formation protein
LKQPEHLILASSSPRRQAILKEAGIIFLVQTQNTEESYPPSLPPAAIPEFLAIKKARPFLNNLNTEVVITADTIVKVDDKVIGKPADAKDAFQMLKSLSGRKHEVITGVAVTSKNTQLVFSDLTEVFFKTLKNSEIEYYIDKYKPFDKAGAYGIQEWIGYVGIEKINGSFYNVMGLPIHKLVDALKKI